MSRKTGVDLELLQEAAQTQLWEHRYREFAMLRSAELIALAQATSPTRHLELILEMQQLALQKLRSLGPEGIRTAEEARRLIDTAIKHERLLLGQPTVTIGQTGEDLDSRIRWLLKKLEGLDARTIEGKKTN